MFAGCGYEVSEMNETGADVLLFLCSLLLYSSAAGHAKKLCRGAWQPNDRWQFKLE